MNFREYLQALKHKKPTFAASLVFFILLALAISLVQPLKYGAETRILVVQKNQYGVDPYQVNKANEYVADVLSDVVVTNSFFNEIINSGFDINKAYFPAKLTDQLEKWQETVSAGANSRGIITISVYHTDRYQADQIIRAINAVIKEKHNLYHGSGDQVEIRVIDQPFTSDLPVKPDVVMNLVFGAMFGILFALSYAYFFPDERYNLRFSHSGARKSKKADKPMAKRRNFENDEEEDYGDDLALPGVDRNRSYDVEDAIRKLRQREKEQAEAPYASYQRGRDNFQKNYDNRNYRNNNMDRQDSVGQGSMKNVF